ncbi:MAG TPA: hypothetical protein ENK25_01480 [Bacteroidetes bacterium]|nr:hypothetical protein [Bacteroidota bacterium]
MIPPLQTTKQISGTDLHYNTLPELAPCTTQFSEHSYGYRPDMSAYKAIGQCRINCMKNSWVIDLDIKGFFDNIDHELLLKAVRYFTDKKHILLYVERWLQVPVQ